MAKNAFREINSPMRRNRMVDDAARKELGESGLLPRARLSILVHQIDLAAGPMSNETSPFSDSHQRTALTAAWRAHAVPASPHLFDALLRLPLPGLRTRTRSPGPAAHQNSRGGGRVVPQWRTTRRGNCSAYREAVGLFGALVRGPGVR